MGVIQKIRKVLGFREKDVTFQPDSLGYTVPYGGGWRYFLDNITGGYKYDDRNSSEYLYNAYGQNPHVYSVTEFISRNYASLPRAWYEDKEGTEPIERLTPELQAVDSLLNNPSYLDSRTDLHVRLALQLLITGNSIAYLQTPVGFGPAESELFVASSKDVTVITEDGSEQSRPIQYDIEGINPFPASQVLHLRFPNPIRSTYWGLSPLHSGQAVYASGNNTFEAAASIHKNRGRTGAIFPKSGDVPLLENQQEKFQKDWDKKTAGAVKFGGIHASPIELGYVGWGLSPSDLKLIEQNIENLRDICRLYGVPTQLLGDTAASTYNNVLEARKAFYNNVLAPLSEKIDKALGAWLLGLMGGDTQSAYYCVDKSKVEVLNQPQTELSSKVIAEVQAGIITAEQAQEILYPSL